MTESSFAATATRPLTPLQAPGCWEADDLRAFTLHMSGHGLCVSSTLMRMDKRYALEQLRHAHTLADDALRGLAMQLFRQFERSQSGVAFTA